MKMFFQEHVILDVKTISRLKSLRAKNFDENTLKIKATITKEQKAIFIVLSRSDVHFGFQQQFFTCPIVIVIQKNVLLLNK